MMIPIIKVQCEQTGQIFALANKAKDILTLEDGCLKASENHKIVGFELISMSDLIKYYKKYEIQKLCSYEYNSFIAKDINDIVQLLTVITDKIQVLENDIQNYENEYHNIAIPTDTKESISIPEWSQLVAETTDIARRIVKNKLGMEVDTTIQNPNWHQGHLYLATDLLVILTDYFSATTLEEKGSCEQRFYELKAASVIEMEE